MAGYLREALRETFKPDAPIPPTLGMLCAFMSEWVLITDKDAIGRSFAAIAQTSDPQQIVQLWRRHFQHRLIPMDYDDLLDFIDRAMYCLQALESYAVDRKFVKSEYMLIRAEVSSLSS